MDKCVILIDNSNVFIEGQKYSAKQKALPALIPGKSAQDPSWRLSFGQLLTCLAQGKQIYAAVLVGSRPPANDGVWESARQSGFQVIVHNRDQNNREKAVDTELVAQGTELICDAPEPMVLIIASGDRDFIPLVKVAQKRKWEVEMWAFSSSFSHLGEMAKTVDRVLPLDRYFDDIGTC